MRQLISVIMAVSLVLTALTSCSGSSSISGVYSLTETPYSDAQKWVYGESEQSGVVQGNDGWYYMYTEETDTNGTYDVSRIKECRYSESESGWVPDICADNTGTVSKTGWRQSMDYMSATLTPAAEDKLRASAVLAFKVPDDGGYQLSISFTAGNDGSAEGGDGVTLSVYGDTQRLYSQNISGLTEGEEISANAMLKKGQYCYIIADPNTNGTNDVCHSVRAEIIQKVTSYVDNTNTWAFGGGYINGSGTVQGDNGWYYLYTEQTNTNGKYDVSQIKESLYKKTGETDPYSGKAFGTWIPAIYDKGTSIPSNENFWRQSAEGYLNTDVRSKPYASAVIGWKAPSAGRYSFDISLFAGSSGDNPDCDGVCVSVYRGTAGIISKCVKDYSYLGCKAEVKLDKDECLYLIVDPQSNGLYDLAEDVKITVKSADA